ncbi:hypothetical protein MKY59_24420 [Paenibacillus sp. FSL W8-0426]|uniref:hypothetical protein n=1 Tax=Paenibacillus sp. FSL W8-0426 TaxID=2921714 RepID=UPI0030DAE028
MKRRKADFGVQDNPAGSDRYSRQQGDCLHVPSVTDGLNAGNNQGGTAITSSLNTQGRFLLLYRNKPGDSAPDQHIFFKWGQPV